MSTVTGTSESVLAIAQRTLSNLEGLEEEHSYWLEALAAQETLDRYWDSDDPEEAGDWLEERETVRLYLSAEAEEWGWTEQYVSEDRDPVWLWLESALECVTLWESSGDSEPEPRGWRLLLGYGGPSIRLELLRDGRATVWASWWSEPEYAHGRLDWLANYLEELGL